MDIETLVIIHTIIDNSMIVLSLGLGKKFISVVHRAMERMERENLLTSPLREKIKGLTDEKLLDLAIRPNMFIGEQYMWNREQRLVRNLIKTVTKLVLALRAQRLTHFTFVSLVSLISYVLKTTKLHPVNFFCLQRLHLGVSKWITLKSNTWDIPLPTQHPGVFLPFHEVGNQIFSNQSSCITEATCLTYGDKNYYYIAWLDASFTG